MSNKGVWFQMSWKKELEEKVSRERLSENLGGKARIKKQNKEK